MPGSGSGALLAVLEQFVPLHTCACVASACAPAARAQASEDGSSCGPDGSAVEGLQCHGLWLNFFDEMWDSVGDGAAATTQQASMREVREEGRRG